jgi:HEAT repeat protein
LWRFRNLNSTNREIRASAAWSLGFIGQHPDMIVPALERALKDDAPQVRREAVLALGKFGTNAVPAKNAIERVTNDPDVMVRNAATNALQQVTGSEAMD